QPGPTALLADQRQRADDMPRRLRVQADDAGAGPGEIRNQAIDRLEHQVHVDGRGDAVIAQRLADHRADRQVGHVVVVHDVEVHPVGAGFDNVFDFLAQAGEIGGKNAGGDQGGLLHGGGRAYNSGLIPIVPAKVSDYPAPPLEMLHQGKVRDIYAVDDDRLLIVASDRLSAFDVVLPDPIPGKGAILTRISTFWCPITCSMPTWPTLSAAASWPPSLPRAACWCDA